jgi:hypothetical protein
MSWVNAVATEQIPKPRVVAGKNQPGPIHLQAIYKINSLSANKSSVWLKYMRAYIARDLEDDI